MGGVQKCHGDEGYNSKEDCLNHKGNYDLLLQKQKKNIKNLVVAVNPLDYDDFPLSHCNVQNSTIDPVEVVKVFFTYAFWPIRVGEEDGHVEELDHQTSTVDGDDKEAVRVDERKAVEDPHSAVEHSRDVWV